jgi:hypothetical protein
MQILLDHLSDIRNFECALALSVISGFAIGALGTLTGWRFAEALAALLERGVSFGWRPAMAYLTGRRKKSRSNNNTDERGLGK